MSYIGQHVREGQAVRTSYTASGGESSVNVTYTIGQLSVFLNGVKLVENVDYTAQNGISVTSISPTLVADDIMEFIALDTFTAADMVPASTGGTFTGNVTHSGKSLLSHVGIGTSAPGDYDSAQDDLVIAGTGHRGMSIISATDSNATLAFGDGTGTAGYQGMIAYLNSLDAMTFRTSAIERMRIDAAGNVTKPVQPSFQAAWTDPSADGVITGTWASSGGASLWNHGNHFNNTGGKFTAPVDGVYYFNLVADINDSNSAFDFYKNGSAFKRGEPLTYIDDPAMGWVTWGFSVMMDLNANDYIQIAVRSGSYSAGDYAAHTGGGSGSWGWFEGYLLG